MAQNGGAGMPGANNNATMYSGVNGSIMPSAGHYSDMATLMQNMETLSGWLQQNREEWGQLQEGLAKVERLSGRLPRDDEQAAQFANNANGDAQSAHPHPTEPPPHPTLPTTTQLQTALSASQTRAAHLESTLATHAHLQTLYEATLTDATERIRLYAFEQQTHTLALHKHYTNLLTQSRNETIEAQLMHQAWQGHLTRLSGNLRAVVTAREEEGRPWVGRLRGLREENRVLRRMVGWEDLGAGDSEEDEEDGVEGRGVEGGQGGAVLERGRGAVMGVGQVQQGQKQEGQQ
ncbi:hypothetical protein LTR36_010504 [Oleoguttula mirabilis]|uniref:Uncharacterized protein n=1 Tax=Oleoguttula mirabilis TaxID=1507867 RepID=A0AAV9J3X7_9PEZI|nr:hypothetical protein LTR36_010504 [Oleoguttula mirabilis]